MARTITAATAVFMLSIPGVFTTPQQLQGYSADDIFSTDPLESAEVLMGVDGNMSAGFVFVAIKQSITLQADSLSNDVFDQWYAAQQQIKDVYFANGVVILNSLGQKWTMTKGVLLPFPPIPDAGKTLKPRKFGITWESIGKAAL